MNDYYMNCMAQLNPKSKLNRNMSKGLTLCLTNAEVS